MKSNWGSPETVREKIWKKWKAGAILTDSGLFPLRIPLKGPKSTEMEARYEEIRRWIFELQGKFTGDESGRLEWKTLNHRRLGKNELPCAVLFSNAESAAALIGKSLELKRYCTLKDSLINERRRWPKFDRWLEERPFELLENAKALPRLLLIAQELFHRPRPDIYLRELSLPGIDTKFIEVHKGVLSHILDAVLPPQSIDFESTGQRGFEQRYGFLKKPELIRFRLLDGEIEGFRDISVPSDDFCRGNGILENIERVFVTENDINGLTFPPVQNAMVLFGRGYSFASLDQAAWMKGKSIFYWGDIDTHGFAILDEFRRYFPGTQSFLMDRNTLDACRPHWGREPKPHRATLTRLSPEEFEIYRNLQDNHWAENLRLEQEFVPYELVHRSISIL